MTAPMTRLPAMPSRSDPANFSARGDAGMTALPVMVDEFNARLPVIDAAVQAGIDSAAAAAAAAASAASALAAPGTNATSTTALAVGAGVLAIVIQANKDIVPGAWLMCARTADPDGVWMLGQARSYTKATGALSLVVAAGDTKGTGTFSDWTLSLSSARSTVFNAVDLSLVGPSIWPSLLADFANSKRLDARFTYTMTSPLTYFDAVGMMRTAPAGVPAFDHDPVSGRCLGLPMWEARTNSIRNCTMQGAVAGTPGTHPTNWAVSMSAVGLSTQVVGVGSENGIDYIDYRFFGTVTTPGNISIFPDGFGYVTAAASGAYWTASYFTKLVAGSNANVSSRAMVVEEYSSAGTYVAGAGYAWAAPTSAALNTQRASATRLLSGGASTAKVGTYLSFTLAAGGVDFTIRIGLPQLELGASPTPAIRTSGTAVTRNGPTPAMAASAFDFNPLEGTLHVVFTVTDDLSSTCACELSDGTAANLITINGANSGGVGPYGEIVASSSSQGAMTDGNLVANSINSAVIAYKANDFAFSRNGRAVVTDSSGSVPTLTTLMVGRSVAGNILNGWISKVAYYPRRLTNTELIALSTL